MSTTPSQPPPPPSGGGLSALPPGLTVIALVKGGLELFAIHLVGPTLLFACLVALLFFSTRKLRTRPVFILNFLSVISGIIIGIVYMHTGIKVMLEPTGVSAGVMNVGTVMMGVVPILVESILVLRLTAVYPIRRDTMIRSCAIFVPLTLIKITRIINIIMWLYSQLGPDRDPNALYVVKREWRLQLEWMLQLFDNCLATGLFLFRLAQSRELMTETSNSRKASGHGGGANVFRSRVEGLFWIAASNFVFPMILSLCQVIVSFIDGQAGNALYIAFGNMYFSIIGVLMATVWVSSSHWLEGQNSTSRTNTSTLVHKSGFREAPRPTRVEIEMNTQVRSDSGFGVRHGGLSYEEKTPETRWYTQS